MPLSFSNISASAIIFMVLYLTVAEIVKCMIKKYGHIKKEI